MFLFTRKKIVVDCFVSDENIYDNYKIDKASRFYPDFIKSAPKQTFTENGIPSPTLKKCIGLLDYYQNGFIMPMWTDLCISINKPHYSWSFSDDSTAVIHNKDQWSFYADPYKHGHLKINSPHYLKEKYGINFIFLKPYWNHLPFDFFSMPSAVINFKYQPSTNINMFINLDENKKNIIYQNTPIVHLIPLTDKNVSLKYHLVDEKEIKKIQPRTLSFTDTYLIRKKQIDAKEKKCPFGFGK